MDKDVERTLKKQLQLLSERSADEKNTVEDLCELTSAMVKVCSALSAL